MRNWMAVLLVGLCSSVVFADSSTDTSEDPMGHSKKDKVEYKCRFEGRRHTDAKDPDDGRVECAVEGSFCRDRRDSKRCKEDDNKIEIRCSRDFDLRARQTAFMFADHTLWINAESDRNTDSDRKIVTVRIEDFGVDLDDRSDRPHEANLVTAKERSESRNGGEANRFDGSCKLEIKHDI